MDSMFIFFKITRLLDLCPRESTRGFRFDRRAQEAVIALGIFYLESGLQVYVDDEIHCTCMNNSACEILVLYQLLI